MTPSKHSLALSPASLNFYCLQPCDSGLPDLAPCQPCTTAGTSSDLSACNWDSLACWHWTLLLLPHTGLSCGCNNQGAASQALDRPWAITAAPMMGLPWPWALQCPLSSSVLLSRVYSLSVIESFAPQMPTVMSTPQQALLEARHTAGWNTTSHTNISTARTNFPTPRRLQLTTVELLHSTSIYWALIMSQARIQTR